jgi:hypothetical protein
VRNVLVHCHSGHSRSVTTAALYIFFIHPELYPTYAVGTPAACPIHRPPGPARVPRQDALQFVKTQRSIGADPTLPEANLSALASRLAAYPLLKMFSTQFL